MSAPCSILLLPADLTGVSECIATHSAVYPPQTATDSGDAAQAPPPSKNASSISDFGPPSSLSSLRTLDAAFSAHVDVAGGGLEVGRAISAGSADLNGPASSGGGSSASGAGSGKLRGSSKRGRKGHKGLPPVVPLPGRLLNPSERTTDEQVCIAECLVPVTRD